MSSLILPGQVPGPPVPRLTGDMRPLTPEVRAQAGLPEPALDARSPLYRKRIQPPDPDTGLPMEEDDLLDEPLPVEALASSALHAAPVGADAIRAVLSYGPMAGQLVIALERKPDWDVAEGESWIVPATALRCLLPILKKITRVKDLTGGAWQVVPGDEPGWSAKAE